MLRDTHVVNIYRRDGAAPAEESQFDPPAEPGKGWALLAEGVRGAYVPTSGSVRLAGDGKEVKIAGTLFLHPARLPGGVALRPDDGVAVVDGRVVAPGRFLIAEVRPIGGGAFDDEMDLESTAEAFV